jgi:serine protease Do
MIERFLAVSAFLIAFSVPSFAKELPDFTELYEKQGPAVVNISSTQTVHGGGQGMMPFPNVPEDDPFYEFFRRFAPPGGQGQQEYKSQSLGSGFIISADGYILTNAHVVNDAEEVIVKLTDKREFKAKIIGVDRRSDVSLLKIDAAGLPKVTMGDPAQLKVGEWVVAIGSPFGLENTVTAGIVSAKGRALPQENYVPFIQTDVAINPGNSGGPLFNLAGEVIGVNSQIYSRTGGFMGLSFAIPIDVALQVVDQLKTQGKVSRGWLGVQIQDVTRELAESFGMKKPQGALVAKILPKSPAEAAGLQIGDIIEEFNGREIESSAALPPMVGKTKIGESAKLKVLRQGKSIEVLIKIGMLPDEEPTMASRDEPESGDKLSRLNVSVANPTDEQREQLELPKTGGVLIVAVKPGPAAEAGIRRGDVILRIQDQTVLDAKHFSEIVKGLPKAKTVAVLVQRRGGSQFLAIKLKD